MAGGKSEKPDIAIVGGGVCGLALALNLHERGIACSVYERAPEVKELGVGITLLPHAMRELTALGLGDALLRAGIENAESCFFNRFGQLIYKEPRGYIGCAASPASVTRPKVQRSSGSLSTIGYSRMNSERRINSATSSQSKRHD